MLKSYRWVGVVGWWVVAHEILVSAKGPLVLGFGFLGLRGLGPGLDNKNYRMDIFLEKCLSKLFNNFKCSINYEAVDVFI